MKLLKLARAGVVMPLLCIAAHLTAQVRTLKGVELPVEAIDRFVSRQMDSLQIPALSLAIIQDGKIVYSKTAGVKNERGEAVDSNTLFEAASMTKPVFAYAVLRLALRGRIHLDTPLYRYYPYDDMDHDDRYKLITARMVLSHTTGFPNWRGGGGRELTINAEPGTRYGYSGEGFEYLSLVIRRLLHQNTGDLIEQEVFRPLSIGNSFLIKDHYVQDHLADGLQDNKEWGRNAVWQRPNVALGLCTEAREYAKLVMQLMKESHLANSVFAAMAVPQVMCEPDKWACLGMFMEQTPYGPKYSHSGNNANRYNSNFEFYKDKNLGYVFFMNCHREPAFTKNLNQFLENSN